MSTQPKPAHTPEPWNRNVSPAWKYPIYASASGDESKRDWIHIAAVLPKNPNNEADLNRIVACVNTMAGIADPEGAIKTAREVLQWFANSAKKQGDWFEEDKAKEALAALGGPT